MLQKRTVTAILGQGVDTKSDPKTLQAGLLTLENVVIQRTGEIKKRPGYRSLGKSVLGGEDLSEGLRLGNFDDELVLLNSKFLYSYAEEAQKWSNKGAVATSSVTTGNIVSNSYEQSSVDAAFSSKTSVYAWEDSRGGVRASVIDQGSGSALVSDTEISAFGERPRCFAVGQYLFVLFYDSDLQALVSRRIDTVNPFEFSPTTIVAADINLTSKLFDVCLVGSSRMVIAYQNTAGNLKLAYLLQNNEVGGIDDGVPPPTSIATEIPNTCLAICSGVPVGGTDTFHVVWFNSSQGLKTAGFFSSFASYRTTQTIDNSVSQIVRNVTAIAYINESTGLSTLEVYSERAAPALTNHYISRAIVAVADNIVSSNKVYQRAAGLASKAYRMLGSTRILVSYASAAELQNTFFSLSDNLAGSQTGWGFNWGFDWGSAIVLPLIQAKVLATVAGGHTDKPSQLPGAWPTSDTTVLISALRKTRIVADNVDTFTLRGVNSIILDHAASRIGLPVQLAGNLHIPGGYLKMYDGVSVTEHGFHLYPENPTTALTGTTGLSNGTYQYQVVYEWIDGRGQIHRSAPSLPVTVSVSGGPKTVNLTIPTLRYTSKKAPERSEVIISIYRTLAGGTLFYKVSSDSDPLYNDVETDTVGFADAMSDVVAGARPLLYTTGGTLENTAVPSCDVARVFKNRVFVAGLERSQDVAFSKAHVRDEGVAFSDFFTIECGSSGGAVTALAVMDEKLIIFKRTSIFILSGDGPTDSGAQSDFGTPQAVASDVGCTEPESVTETPEGVMFKSAKGIYLLTRSLQVEYVGAKVEKFNARDVTGATVVPNLNQVRFTTSDGETLCFDYFFKIWTVFTNQKAVSCLGWKQAFAFLTSEGEVLVEDESSFSDAGVPIPTRIGTSWFSFAGLQGFQRVYQGTLLGEYVGSHRLRIRVGYDFEAHYEEDFLLDPVPVVTGPTFGDGTFGSGPFGGGTGVYQFEFRPARQKCETMRLLIEDVFPENEGTGAFRVSALTFVVGTKSGANRMGVSNKMTGT